MGRLTRWMFNGITAVSLMVCVATAGVWVRSYFVMEEFGYDGPLAGGFAWSKGHISLESSVSTRPPAFDYYGFPPRDLVSLRRNTADSHYGWGPVTWGETWNWSKYVIVPCWLIVAMTAIAPAMWTVGFIRRKRRVQPGHCSCGYDLQGNTSGVCPECGKKIDAKA